MGTLAQIIMDSTRTHVVGVVNWDYCFLEAMELATAFQIFVDSDFHVLDAD
jgi:hypothetical protein